MSWNFFYFYRDSFGKKRKSEKTFVASNLIDATYKFCDYCELHHLNIISFYID